MGCNIVVVVVMVLFKLHKYKVQFKFECWHGSQFSPWTPSWLMEWVVDRRDGREEGGRRRWVVDEAGGDGVRDGEWVGQGSGQVRALGV